MVLCITVFYCLRVINVAEKVQIGIDIETVGKYDSCVVTRIAITPFYFSETNTTFEEFCDRTLVIAFDQAEQDEHGRIREAATVQWWESQTEELKVISYYPTDNDMKVHDAFELIKTYLKKWRYDYMNSHLWARSSFEIHKLQSMQEMAYGKGMDMKVLNGWNWLDFKTSNFILTGGETMKYVPKGVDMNGILIHDPKIDNSLDIIRLIQLVNGGDEE